MELRYIKKCPYCTSINNHLEFNAKLARMISKCEDCGYAGSNVFPDIEVSQVKAVEVKEE